MDHRRPSRAAQLGALVGLAWIAVVLLWLLDVLGRGAPSPVSRLAVALAATGLVAVAARAVARLWREGPATRALAVVLAFSVVFCFAGLDHEIGARDFGDEGTYRAQAERINQEGQILRPWFVYPHLLFYLDALALWMAGLFQAATDALARILYGVEGSLAVSVLVTRAVTAALGALIPLPVFITARRLAGDAAAISAAALAALSPLAVELAHQNLSDVAAALFAALAVAQASALLDRERTQDYLLAGAWAGLAAGSKYPAGVVAVAIAALWLRWRLRERRMGWGLLWAGLASLTVFLATTPSLLVFPGQASAGEAGVLFGARLYAQHGWAGVSQASNSLYYGGQLVANFGPAALVLGLVGLAGLRRRELLRLAWLLPFPAVHLALLLSLEMALVRNLMPVLPVLSVLLGCGLAGVWRWLGRWSRVRAPATAVLALVALAWPALATVTGVTRLARPTTREEAAAWSAGHLPPGSFLVQEAYTPRVGPEWQFPARHPRFAIRLDREELEQPAHDFLFLAGGSYNRFLRHADDPERAHQAARYRAIFERYELVRDWRPGRLQGGSELRLYRLDPDPVPWRDRRRFLPGDALLRSPDMAPADPDGAIAYTAAGQWSLFKAHLVPGRYRVRLATDAASGRIEVRDRSNRVVADLLVSTPGAVELELPDREKYFVYVELPAGSGLRGLSLRRLPPAPRRSSAPASGRE